MLSPPPGRFSTLNGWPYFRCSFVGQQAGENVAAAAGRQRNDDPHRARRPALRRRRLRR
jgi:hypothetical protein